MYPVLIPGRFDSEPKPNTGEYVYGIRNSGSRDAKTWQYQIIGAVDSLEEAREIAQKYTVHGPRVRLS